MEKLSSTRQLLQKLYTIVGAQHSDDIGEDALNIKFLWNLAMGRANMDGREQLIELSGYKDEKEACDDGEEMEDRGEEMKVSDKENSDSEPEMKETEISNQQLEKLAQIQKLLQKLLSKAGIHSTEVTGDGDSQVVAAPNKEKSGSAQDEKETEIANQLRECCDRFGQEKQDMLRQSAGYLLELGKLYKDNAINGKAKQQKSNFVKSAALINGAIVRYQKLGLDDEMNASRNELRILHEGILKIDRVNGDKTVDIHKFSQEVKTSLHTYRKELYAILDSIIVKKKTFKVVNQKENFGLIQMICQLSTEYYLDIMRMVANKCEDIMGKPPCKFSFIGLGPLARKEATLYSEFEHTILLQDRVKDNPATKDYFRWFSTIFRSVIIGLGETPIPSVNVRSLNDHYSGDVTEDWFIDLYTPHGIAFDGMMPHSRKVSLSLPQPTKYLKHVVKLIQLLRKLGNWMPQEDSLRKGFSPSDYMKPTCLVYGDQEVYSDFLSYSHHKLNQQRAGETAKQQLQLLLSPSFMTQKPWYLYNIQEKLTWSLSAISTSWGFECQSSYEIVDKMKDAALINDETYQKLRNAIDVVMEIKMKRYQIRCCQGKKPAHIDTSFVEEGRVMDCFLAVISHTVELQRQLQASISFDNDRLYPGIDLSWWVVGETLTLSAPAFEVSVKEVEFGLGFASQTLNNYEMSNEKLAASEAKFAIKTASFVLTAYFDQIYLKLVDGRMEQLPNLLQLPSLTSTLQNLESHCNSLLQFTDGNDKEFLLNYYPMMFLIHCIQNQLLQALGEYEQWQELCLAEKDTSIFSHKTRMSLELLHIHIMTEALDANDMMTRIEQMISTESEYHRKCFLNIGLCLAKLKLRRKNDARKDLCMLVSDIKNNPSMLEKEAQELLLKNIFDIQLTENCLIDAVVTFHEEISAKPVPHILVSRGNISVYHALLLQERLQSTWAENLSILLPLLQEYHPNTLQCVYHADPLECGFSLALAISPYNQRKCVSLLWKILHTPDATKAVMQRSVIEIFNILSLRRGLVKTAKWINTVQSTARTQQITASDRRKKALGITGKTKQKDDSEAIISASLNNRSSNEEIPSTSLLLESDGQTSNQVEEYSVGKSVALPQPKSPESLSHGSSADDQNLRRTEAVASESKSVLIHKEGGKIKIGGCAVFFPPRSFDDVAEVYAKAEIDSSKWPPKYICITAMLWVKSQRKLRRRASVSMKSWCMKNCSDSRKILVDVLHRKIGSSKWDVVARLPLNDLKIFHFECTDFSPYILGIHEDELPATDLVIEGHVYAGRGNNFSLAFFLQHDLIENFVKEKMAERQCKFQLNFNSLPVKANDKISANLKCMIDAFHFPKEFKEDFEIDNDFVRLRKKTFFHSLLIGSTKETQFVPFECAVQKNEVLADGPHFFNYEMLPVPSAPQSQDPGIIRLTADIPAAIDGIRDLHLFGTGNTHDHRQYSEPPALPQTTDESQQMQETDQKEARKDDESSTQATKKPK